MTTECLQEAMEQDQAEQGWAYIAVCPYCGAEHPTDVVNASGECPTIACCGETHCVDLHHPDIKDDDENFSQH